MVAQTIAERWLPVVGYEGAYEVSDHGRVRSLDRLIKVKGCVALRKHKAAILKPCFSGNGYLEVGLSRSRFYVHRLVLSTFVGMSTGAETDCDHIDGVRTNNRLSNLRWVTRKENLRAAVARRGEWFLHGEDSVAAKLTAKQVRVLRHAWACRLRLPNPRRRVGYKELAEAFGVSKSTIQAVSTGMYWSHL